MTGFLSMLKHDKNENSAVCFPIESMYTRNIYIKNKKLFNI